MSDIPVLRILQYNIRHELGTITALLADRVVQGFDILAIQEPSFNAYNGSSYNPSSSAFHLAHRTGADTRTCFYINKKLKLDNWEVEYHSRDVCTLRLSVTTQDGSAQLTEFQLHNVYNPSPSLVTNENPSSLALAEGLIQRMGEHILLGDFNLYYPNWNNYSRYIYHAEVDRLVAITVE